MERWRPNRKTEGLKDELADLARSYYDWIFRLGYYAPRKRGKEVGVESLNPREPLPIHIIQQTPTPILHHQNGRSEEPSSSLPVSSSLLPADLEAVG